MQRKRCFIDMVFQSQMIFQILADVTIVTTINLVCLLNRPDCLQGRHERTMVFVMLYSSHLLLQDWGRPGDLWNLQIRWHVASAEEKAFIFYILDLLLQPELQRLQRYAQGEQNMSRSDAMGQREMNRYLDSCGMHLWLLSLYGLINLMMCW